MQRVKTGPCQVALPIIMLATGHVWAHNDHMLVGPTADGQLKWHPNAVASVQNGAIVVLNAIPPGGPISGFSAAIPGFSMVLAPSPENDIYPPAAGADIWLEITRIDPSLIWIQPPTYIIISSLVPPEMQIGSSTQTHVHPLYLLDTSDPAYDASRCFWEVTFILKDKGTTHYQNSVPITFRFVAGTLICPADFNCDSHVDEADLALFIACATGPAIPYDVFNLDDGCAVTVDHQGRIPPDIDRDGDVDGSDFGLFQRCFAGPTEIADPFCAN